MAEAEIVSAPGTDFTAKDGGDAVDLSKSHPLQNTWTLWFDTKVNSGSHVVGVHNWGQQLKRVTDFSTVEEFWSLFNHIAEPTTLQASSTYHLFKKGIEPKWEDPQNADGAKLQIVVPKKKAMINEFWLNTVMAVVGETFDSAESDDICGIVLSIRKIQDRIALWTKSAENSELQTSIKDQWCACICEGGLSDEWTLEFSKNSDQRRQSERRPGGRR